MHQDESHSTIQVPLDHDHLLDDVLYMFPVLQVPLQYAYVLEVMFVGHSEY
jgi:hypothetical protein